MPNSNAHQTLPAGAMLTTYPPRCLASCEKRPMKSRHATVKVLYGDDGVSLPGEVVVGLDDVQGRVFSPDETVSI